MTGFTYKSYSFTEKDPIIDEVRTVFQDSGKTKQWVEDESGVTSTTLHNWFEGKTRKPAGGDRQRGAPLAWLQARRGAVTSVASRLSPTPAAVAEATCPTTESCASRCPDEQVSGQVMVKFKIGFEIGAETLFGMLSKMLPIDNLHVEEIVEPPPRFNLKAQVEKLGADSLLPPKFAPRKKPRAKRSGRAVDLKAGINRIIVEVLSDGLPHHAVSSGLTSSRPGSRRTRSDRGFRRCAKRAWSNRAATERGNSPNMMGFILTLKLCTASDLAEERMLSRSGHTPGRRIAVGTQAACPTAISGSRRFRLRSIPIHRQR